MKHTLMTSAAMALAAALWGGGECLQWGAFVGLGFVLWTESQGRGRHQPL